MGSNADIYLRLHDEYSSTLNNANSATSNFESTLGQASGKAQEYYARLGELKTIYSDLSAQMATAKNELKDAQNQFKKTGDAADAQKVGEASAKYEDLRQRVKDAGKAMSDTRSDINDLYKSEEDAADGADNLGESFKEASTEMKIAEELAGAFGDTFSTIASASFGDRIGGSLGNIVSSAIEGGINDGLLGAVAGGAAAGLAALTEYLTNGITDGIEYGAALTESLNEQHAATAESGSSTAGSRETNLVSFSTLTGSVDKASEYLAQIHDFAQVTPYMYDDLADTSRTLLAYGFDLDLLPDLLTSVGDASSAMGIGADGMSTVSTYLGKMSASNKASSEYIMPLIERGFDIYGWLGEYLGTDSSGAAEAITNGDVTGSELVDIILDKFDELYSGSMEAQSQTFEGLTSTLEGVMQDVENAYGEGYNETRKSGLESEIETWGGSLGEQVSLLQSIAGSAAAYAENKQEEMLDQVLSAVLEGSTNYEGMSDEVVAQVETLRTEYTSTMDAYNEAVAAGDDELAAELGDKLANTYEEAEALGQVAYDTSDFASTIAQNTADMNTEINSVAVATDAAANSVKVQISSSTSSINSNLQSIASRIQSQTVNVTVSGASGASTTTNFASAGIWGGYGFENVRERRLGVGQYEVPYSGFPALLHEGERVLTGNRARQMDAMEKGGGGVVININSCTVRSDADIEAIGTEILTRLRQAARVSA